MSPTPPNNCSNHYFGKIDVQRPATVACPPLLRVKVSTQGGGGDGGSSDLLWWPGHDEFPVVDPPVPVGEAAPAAEAGPAMIKIRLNAVANFLAVCNGYLIAVSRFTWGE
jgi:hypothetical protein